MEPRRQPQNLQALLRFAMDHTRSEDAPEASRLEQMDPERRRFLEEALKSMTIDVIEELEKASGALESPTATIDEKIEALNAIRDYIDNLDFANSFVKIGGSKVIVESLNSNNAKMKTTAAHIIAEMSQSNPFCQKHFIDLNVLPTLVSYLNDGEDVASSSMHAVSALVRHFEPGCAAFVEIGGLECILGCLHSEHSRVFIKACFLINTLSAEFQPIRDELIKLGAIEKLSRFVEPITGFDIKIETVLSALNALIDCENSKQRIAQTNISESLQILIENNADKPECEEMIEYSKSLLECFNGTQCNAER